MTADATFNRSEKVRQRRKSRSQERITRAAAVTHLRPAASPAVTVRGRSMGQPILKKASTQTRRKYYVALDTAGAELSMPSIPIIRPGWRILSGLVIMAMVAMLIVVSTNAAFAVKAPRITGLQRLNQADIEAILGLKGKSIITVDPAAMRTDLEKAFPELSAVAVSVSLPNNVAIAVRERQPVLAWNVKDKMIWIDADGVMFNPRGDVGSLLTIQADDNPPMAPVLVSAADLTQAPAVTPAAGSDSTIAVKQVEDLSKQRVDMKIISAIEILKSQMPENSSLVYTALNGLGWDDSRGWKVFFGVNLDDMQEKLTMYQTIIDLLTQKDIKPSVISVENIHAPFYRLEH